MARLTAKQVAEHSGISERLIRGVLRQLGGGQDAWDSLRDAANHGADAGFCGFTYYSDTVGFFKQYRKDIAALAEQQASDCGENVSEMVASFGCLSGQELHELRAKHRYSEIPSHERQQALAEYLPSINRCLYGGRISSDDDIVANALAWFALEEVGRAAEDCDA